MLFRRRKTQATENRREEPAVLIDLLSTRCVLCPAPSNRPAGRTRTASTCPRCAARNCPAGHAGESPQAGELEREPRVLGAFPLTPYFLGPNDTSQNVSVCFQGEDLLSFSSGCFAVRFVLPRSPPTNETSGSPSFGVQLVGSEVWLNPPFLKPAWGP